MIAGGGESGFSPSHHEGPGCRGRKASLTADVVPAWKRFSSRPFYRGRQKRKLLCSLPETPHSGAKERSSLYYSANEIIDGVILAMFCGCRVAAGKTAFQSIIKLAIFHCRFNKIRLEKGGMHGKEATKERTAQPLHPADPSAGLVFRR